MPRASHGGRNCHTAAPRQRKNLRIFAAMKPAFLTQPIGRPTPAGNRVGYLDVAKGVGIILVVWFHTDIVPGRLLNLFFMPLFFLISGVFLNPGETPATFVGKKIKGWGMPLAAFFAISLAAEWWFHDMVHWHDKGSAGRFTFEQVGNVALWFLPTLLYTALGVYAIERWVKWRPAKAGVYMAIVAAGWAMSNRAAVLPLYMCQAFLAIPYFALGHYLQRPIRSGAIFNPAMIAAAAALTAWTLTRDTLTNFYQLIYAPRYVPSVTAALSLVYMVLLLSWLADKWDVSRWIGRIGRMSLVVFGLHMLVVAPVVELVYPAAGIEKHFDGFDTQMALSLLFAIVVAGAFTAAGEGFLKLKKRITAAASAGAEAA